MKDLKNKLKLLLVVAIISFILLIVFIIFCKEPIITILFTAIPITSIIYTIKSYKEVEELQTLYDQRQQEIEMKTIISKTNSEQQKIAFAKNLLIDYFMELGKEMAKDLDNQLLLNDTKKSLINIFNENKNEIELQLRKLIDMQEIEHGDCYTENCDDELSTKVTTYLEKHAFAINLYYLLELHEVFKQNFDAILDIIINTIENEENNPLDNCEDYTELKNEFIKIINLNLK